MVINILFYLYIIKNMNYININDIIVLNDSIHKILQIKIKKYIYKKKIKE